MIVRGTTTVDVSFSKSEINRIVRQELYRIAGFTPGCRYIIREAMLIQIEEVSAGLHSYDEEKNLGLATNIQRAAIVILGEL